MVARAAAWRPAAALWALRVVASRLARVVVLCQSCGLFGWCSGPYGIGRGNVWPAHKPVGCQCVLHRWSPRAYAV